MHDPTKVLLGSTSSSDRIAHSYENDPATFEAGLAVRLSSTGDLSLSSGTHIGVSLGKDLSDAKKTSVLKTGLGVPVQLTDDSVFASVQVQDILYTSKLRGTAGNALSIIYVDGAGTGEANVSVVDGDIEVEIDDTVTTALTVANAINAHPEVSLLCEAVVDGGENATAQDAFTPAVPFENGDDGFSYVVKGAKMHVSPTTGKAITSGGGAVATDAVYISGVLTGIKEDSSETFAALVDIAGSL
jgi:hypothetical protein